MSTVSVIVPCFNSRVWIGETLRSVFDQGVEDLEIIVVDDGSTDGSADLVARNFPGVQLVRTQHAGPSSARNMGTQLCTGGFIQYLDADDLLAPGKLQRQSRALIESDADVAYGDWSELPPGGRIVSRRIEGDADIALFTDFWCPPAAYLFRREIVERVGGWRDDLPVIQDARFVLDCALHGGRFVYCSGEVARYRVHSTGSVSTRDPLEFTRDCLRNAQSVEEWWRAHGGVESKRKAALIKVYAQVARSSFDADRASFETSYAALERLAPGYVPHTPGSLRLLAQVAGYRRAEGLASRYRTSKRRLRARGVRLTSHHATLKAIAHLAYNIPGVTSLARGGVRVALQRTRLSRTTKQQLHNFFAVDVAPHGIAACTVRLNQERDIRLRLRVRDDLTRYWYFWGYAHYELGTTRLLRRLLERKRVFFDVGANVGYHTFLAAALLEGRGRVHAFEPWSELYEELAVNAQLNGFRSLTLSQAALGEDDGEARLFLPRTNEWTTASLVSDAPRQQFERVQTLRFDSYCRQRGIPCVDLLKIDVEGAELQVLRGMGNLLSRWRPDIILEALEPFAAELDAFFAETPYRKFRIRDTGLEELRRISAEPHDRNIYLSCEPEVAWR